jgi:hypothetical protein
MPKSETGSIEIAWEYPSVATDPTLMNDAIAVSTKALTCTTPRPKTTVPNRVATLRTNGDARSGVKRNPGSHRSTSGSWIANCSALPATLATAAIHAIRSADSPLPCTSSATITVRLNSTGDAYDRKKRRCELSTPRHQAESTSMPTPGKIRRTSRTARARASPAKPGAIRSTSSGVAAMPPRTSPAVVSASSEKTAPATRPASSRFPSARRRE